MKTPIERARELYSELLENWIQYPSKEAALNPIQSALDAQQAESDARIKELEAVIEGMRVHLHASLTLARELANELCGLCPESIHETQLQTLTEELAALSAGLGEAGKKGP